MRMDGATELAAQQACVARLSAAIRLYRNSVASVLDLALPFVCHFPIRTESKQTFSWPMHVEKWSILPPPESTRLLLAQLIALPCEPL